MERVYFIAKNLQSYWEFPRKKREKFPFSELAGLTNPHAATKTEIFSWGTSQTPRVCRTRMYFSALAETNQWNDQPRVVNIIVFPWFLASFDDSQTLTLIHHHELLKPRHGCMHTGRSVKQWTGTMQAARVMAPPALCMVAPERGTQLPRGWWTLRARPGAAAPLILRIGSAMLMFLKGATTSRFFLIKMRYSCIRQSGFCPLQFSQVVIQWFTGW